MLNKYNFNDRSKIFFIFLIALIIRYLFSYLSNNFQNNFIEDEGSYYENAYIFLNDGFFNDQTHDRVPLQSIIILPIIKFFSFEISTYLIKLLMIIVSSLTCVMVFFNAKALNLSSNKSMVLALIYTLYPFSIYFSSRYLSENLASLLILIISFFVFKYTKSQSNKYLIYTAFFIGLITLTRSSFYYYIFILILFILLNSSSFRDKLFKTLLVLSIFFTTLSPWIFKNYIVHEDYIPTTTRLGYGLWLSNNDFNDIQILSGNYSRSKIYQKHIDLSHEINNLSQRADYLKKKSLENILSNKTIFSKTVLVRFVKSLHFKPNPYTSYKTSDFLMLLYLIPVYLFSILGMIKARLDHKYLFILLSFLYVLIIHTPFYGFPRFRFPIDSLLIIIAWKHLLNFNFKKS